MALTVAKLHHVKPGEGPGYTRRRVGKGFVYLDTRGKRIVDEGRLARIRRLAIPPAWRDVWICPDPDGHVQATGRDARGRLQYRYHTRWSEHRGRQKFAALLDFADALPALRRRVNADLRCDCVCRAAVLATMVALLEKGHLRVGNEEYARDNRSHGVATLERRHVRVSGSRIQLDYRGKSGVQQRIRVDDAVLARRVKACLALPGRRVFKYRDDAGRVRRVSSADVNSYLREAGLPLTAKYFRTWAASLCALARLAAQQPPASPTAARRTITAVVREVAERMGHTPAVCRASYVHPRVLELFIDGELAEKAASAAVHEENWRFAGRWPKLAEKTLVEVLAG
jgi:DNA topoisomerase-1